MQKSFPERLSFFFPLCYPICEKCEFRNSCAGGCRGKAVEGKENADLLGRDMDACKFFKQGWYEKVTKLMKELLPS